MYFFTSGKLVRTEKIPLRYVRNLTAEEIFIQVENVLQQIDPKLINAKRLLFSYMGMGEPLLNYDNVIKSIKILAKKYPFSRATISTVGIEPQMRSLANEKVSITLKLHLSLHAPNNKLRCKIIPNCCEINSALKALKYFSERKKVISKTNYLLIKDFNDSPKHAFQLAKLLRPYAFVVKLSKLNPSNGLKPSDDTKFEMFEEILHAQKIATCRFISIGTDISAGCGQFRRYYYNKL